MTTQLNPARNEGESFEDYKIRREFNATRLKIELKGKLFHDSSNKNTYVKPKEQK